MKPSVVQPFLGGVYILVSQVLASQWSFSGHLVSWDHTEIKVVENKRHQPNQAGGLLKFLFLKSKMAAVSKCVLVEIWVFISLKWQSHICVSDTVILVFKIWRKFVICFCFLWQLFGRGCFFLFSCDNKGCLLDLVRKGRKKNKWQTHREYGFKTNKFWGGKKIHKKADS